MRGILKKDGEDWYVEYQEQSTSSLSTGTPSKFALRADNIERIVNGTWVAVEGKSVSFEVTSLPLPPYYEVNLDSSDMRRSPYAAVSSNKQVETKKTKTRYRYRVYFSGSSRTIECDEVHQGSEIYYFQKHVKRNTPKYEYVDGYSTKEVYYDKEVIAQFPIINTAIYDIEKFEVEDK